MSMDALEFLRERKRLCNLQKDCNGCPFGEANCSVSNIMPDEDYKRVIATVEQWSKANPRKTRQGEFLKQWPEAEIDENGCLRLCPIAVSAAYRNKAGGCASPTRPQCAVCCREFWSQEVE